MADSTITKRALANSLKELMSELPFEKISVGKICERCFMNRKSFYYHFKDKYDLMNWIFDSEFTVDEGFNEARFAELCQYLYDNRAFYRRAFKIQGQNSFSTHFRDRMAPIVESRVSTIFTPPSSDFARDFFTDAFICAITRWLKDKNCIDAPAFVSLVHSVFINR